MSILEHVMGSGNSPMSSGAITGGGATGIVATGTTSADAKQLSTTWNAITTSSASTGVILPKTAGGYCGIRNDSGQTITVYPGTGNTVNNAASSVTLGNGLSMLAFKTSATTWATITSA